MKVESKLREEYIPKFNRNRDLPEDEQVVVTLRYPSLEEFEELAGTSAMTVKLLQKCVVKIERLEHNGEPVVDGVALLKQVRGKLADLSSELYLKILTANRVSEEEEKNSEGQPS